MQRLIGNCEYCGESCELINLELAGHDVGNANVCRRCELEFVDGDIKHAVELFVAE